MLKTRDLVICTAVGAALLSLSLCRSHAAEFDFLRPKRAAKSTARGQTPAWQPSGTSAVSAPTYYESAPPSGWGGYDSSACFNCGDCDHCIWYTQTLRRKCGSTWYPRVAPYCQAGWGWTQPCWRRMADNYNCPRPEGPVSKPRSASPPPVPAAEPLPAIPEPPPPASSSLSRPSRAGDANRTASSARSSRPIARPPVSSPPVQPEIVRYTRFGNILDPKTEADNAQPADNETLESQMEATENEVAENEDRENEASESEVSDSGIADGEVVDSEIIDGETVDGETDGTVDSDDPDIRE